VALDMRCVNAMAKTKDSRSVTCSNMPLGFRAWLASGSRPLRDEQS
jgi:hypothetical protein